MKMKPYKLRIYVRVILIRMEAEQTTVDEILAEYHKLKDYEKAEIKAEVERQLAS